MKAFQNGKPFTRTHWGQMYRYGEEILNAQPFREQVVLFITDSFTFQLFRVARTTTPANEVFDYAMSQVLSFAEHQDLFMGLLYQSPAEAGYYALPDLPKVPRHCLMRE